MKEISQICICVKSNIINGKFDLANSNPVNEFFEISKSVSNREISISIKLKKNIYINELSIKATLPDRILFIRDPSYSWKIAKRRTILPALSNKIIKLQNQKLITGKYLNSTWEIKSNSYTEITDWLIKKECTPIIKQDDSRQRFQKSFLIKKGAVLRSGFISSTKTLEWSRCKQGFLPVLILTDHSDFDTTDKLDLVLKILGNIKTTKGYFLGNTFEELKAIGRNPIMLTLERWTKNGHEMAFRTALRNLSNNIRLDNIPRYLKRLPFKTRVWIDHGQVNYNLAQQDEDKQKQKWFGFMKKFGFEFFWNYVDSYDARCCCLNQLKPEDMTINARIKTASRNKLFFSKGRMVFRLRNFLRFNGDEHTTLTAFEISRLIKHTKHFDLLDVYRTIIDLIVSAFKLMIYYFKEPTYAKYSPIIFWSPEYDSWMFQSLTIRDFEESLMKKSFNYFQRENGFVIAHTYLCYSGGYHPGRIIDSYEDEVKLNRKAVANIRNVQDQINQGLLANPTLTEEFDYIKKTSELFFISSGSTISLSGRGILVREIR